MKKVIVFGGSGFLGSHVADALSDAGHVVTIVDVRPSPFVRNDQKMIVGDILDPDLVARLIAGHEIVYHFAGIADIDECLKKPIDTVRYNILGTTYILEACRHARVERFLFASSSYVYSKYGYFYRTSKQTCESLIEDYHALYGLSYTCLRYGSLYGERADDRNSIYRILKQAMIEGRIVYRGGGDEIREFIHIQDAAQASVKVLEPEFANQHIILSGTQTLHYRELLEMIREMLNNRVEIVMEASDRDAHYKITPYNFSPKLGRKYLVNPHIDMGQGLLLCMAELYEKIQHEKSSESPKGGEGS